jgi:hypothetical protein
MKKMGIVPHFIQSFVEQQKTVPIDTLSKNSSSPLFPYSEYWRRAVAAMLLSCRIASKYNDFPNMTDVNRICKEANFSPYWFEPAARFLISAKIIRQDWRSSRYEAGEASDAFWNHRIEPLQAAARSAFLDLIQRYPPSSERRPNPSIRSGLDDCVALFAAAFAGLALPEDRAGDVFLKFSQLPSCDLSAFGKQIGMDIPQLVVDGWKKWIEQLGQQALLYALYAAGWAYVIEHRKEYWFCLNDTARIILGLQTAPALPTPTVDFKVLTNFCVLAGADLPPEKLVPLFRHCRIKRIDHIFEFQLEKKQLTETLKAESADKLREILEEAGPLPATIASLLGNKPLQTGELRIRYCCAIIQAENPEMLDVIRKHSRLKGYLEPGAPKGYLLIKPQSNPSNFIQRCQELGFKVTFLQG